MAYLAFIVIIFFLVIRGRALPLRSHISERLPRIGSAQIRIVPTVVILGFAVVSLFVFTTGWVDAVTTTGIFTFVCLSLVVVAGYAGQLSLAQYALAGDAAFISARLADVAGLPFLAALVVGVVGTIIVAAIVALPAVRVRGVNLAVVTLGLATLMSSLVLNNPDYTGGTLRGTIVANPHVFGLNVDSTQYPKRYAIFVLVLLLLALLAVRNVRRGSTGRRLIAVRDNERAAASLGIHVRVDSPGVGSNLDDHVEGLVFWEASKPMVTTSTQWWEIGLFTTVDEGSAQPDLMMHYGSVPFDMNTLRRGYPTTDNGFCLTPNVTQGRSRGTVRLRSADFRDRPRVDPRYFTDPEGYDERIMLTGVRLARTIAEQAPLAPWVGRELAPGPDATTDDELLDYIHQCHNTVYHPAATARMGSVTDPMAVLDPQLRVKGTSRLRVVDASAMPKLPAVNPNITVMTMAEKCADLILQS